MPITQTRFLGDLLELTLVAAPLLSSMEPLAWFYGYSNDIFDEALGWNIFDSSAAALAMAGLLF